VRTSLLSAHAPPSTSSRCAPRRTSSLLPLRSLPPAVPPARLAPPQSPQGNDLDIAPPGGAANHVDNPVPAQAFPITVGGAKAYALWFTGGQGYRRDATKGIATGKCVLLRRDEWGCSAAGGGPGSPRAAR
jgi:hypothetical protein